MKSRKYRYFVCDFETTVYDGQKNTEVWAAACVELFSEDVKIFHSIAEQFEYFKGLNQNVVAYYHNLKFDGSFWLSYFMLDLGLKQAIDVDNKDINNSRFDSYKDMKNNTFSYNIADTGQWYRISVKINGKIIEFRDSLKLLPFSVKRLGESFHTKHKKLDMEYKGLRYAGCEITESEQKYIANDVLVVKEGLEIMFTQGNKKLTIGSCCLAEFKKTIGGNYFERYFPNVYEMLLKEDVYGSKNVGEYIKKSYHGGWCYLVKGKEKKLYKNGTTADVNSLYPSMMSGESGNVYPIGKPVFWKGNYIPTEAKRTYYFVRIKTRFYIKENMLPFIQLKNTFKYRATEMLETSDIFNKEDGKYYREYTDFDGNIVPAINEMTMTMTDFTLFLEHYDVEDFEILDGCYFATTIGLFDKYIEKYKKIKMTTKGAERELAKLFLNNLYGKMASSPTSNFKVAYLKEDKTIGFYTILAQDKIPGYIPVGSAITSYARNFTIRAAQKNYHGKNKCGFIYADTDSIHCDLPPDKIKGIKVNDNDFCCWKLEGSWDYGWFVRQKTYIERITHENQMPVEKPYYNVKCAGMPQRCKDLFVESLTQEGKLTPENDDEEAFLNKKRNLDDFDIGLRVPSKLLPRRILGGVLLVPTTYEMR